MVDILRPELLWIEGRCYRISDSATDFNSVVQEHDLYENDVHYNEYDEEDNDEEFEVVMVDNSRFKTSLHVSKHYIGSIIGKKGATKCRIERDTRTDIKIPRHGQEGDIVILGPAESNLRAARRRLNTIVVSSRMKQRPTHFISIPMNQPNIMERFELFKESVLRECPSRGLDESVFVEPQKLHLTVGVMCLMDNEERMFASKLLSDAKDIVVRPLLQGHMPLKIRLKGLSYMNDDPKEMHVLYGDVQGEGDSEGLLQLLSDRLFDYFNRAGFMPREFGRENIKLHVTFINSKMRRESDGTNIEESRNSRQPRISFDGSEVLRKFVDYDFGVMEMRSIHLSQLHSTGPDGYYQSTCVIQCD